MTTPLKKIDSTILLAMVSEVLNSKSINSAMMDHLTWDMVLINPSWDLNNTLTILTFLFKCFTVNQNKMHKMEVRSNIVEMKEKLLDIRMTDNNISATDSCTLLLKTQLKTKFFLLMVITRDLKVWRKLILTT